MDIYDTITLPAGAEGYFILRGTTTSEYQSSTTNKACIYQNAVEIECDTVKFDLETLDAHLRIDKTVDNTDVNVGDTVTFTLRVRNDGETPMTNFTVTDTLPSGVKYVNNSQNSNGFGFNAAGQTLVWHNYNGTLQAGQSITISFRATVEKIGTHTNRVCLTHDEFPTWSADSRSTENCDPADVIVKEKPYCGDGIRNGGEYCDYNDYNGRDGRGDGGCTTTCDPIYRDPYCGNGRIDYEFENTAKREACECPSGTLFCKGSNAIFHRGYSVEKYGNDNYTCNYCHIE
ncbi:MAG: DUF11 domain-containing protein [Candidatus Peribacteria bacterium]|nr:DUF11 domain-containing protein [Candidatus Peribacteria bacterium]